MIPHGAENAPVLQLLPSVSSPPLGWIVGPGATRYSPCEGFGLWNFRHENRIAYGTSNMTLYSYIVTHDTGFSPNPFFGYCTLACCKPEIRRKAQKDDWIVGLAPKAQGNKVVYFMRVDEVMDFRRYWNDRRFRQKRSRYDMDVRFRSGDNIYEPLPNGGFRQLPSRHSDGEHEHSENKEHDLGGKNVLISETFAYFGSKPVTLPRELECLIVGRGHRSRFSDGEKNQFLKWASPSKFRVRAAPGHWPEDDKSWKSAACGSR
jgi:hypothetical protein